jgi:hypothetical protein
MYFKDLTERATGMVQGQVFCSVIYIEKGTEKSSFNEDGSRKVKKAHKYAADPNKVDERVVSHQEGGKGHFMITLTDFRPNEPTITLTDWKAAQEEFYVNYSHGANK